MCDDLVSKMFLLYSNELYKIAMHYLHNTEDAKDVIQNVFVKLAIFQGPFDSYDGCKAWLIRVTINESKNYLKLWWNRNVEKNDIELTHKEPIVSEESIYGHLTSNEIMIVNIINSMNPRYKDPLLLLVEGYSYKEISIILKLNESTLRTRIERAKKILRERIDQEEKINNDLLYCGRN